MKCEFTYCVHNENGFCLLEEIAVNAWGMCEECILVDISEADLRAGKEEYTKIEQYR